MKTAPQFCVMVAVTLLIGSTCLAQSAEEVARLVKDETAEAEAGDATAQFSLGLLYTLGAEGVERNAALAAKWFRLAAEQGHAAAQCRLARHYEFGAGVPQSDKEAVKWYAAAAAQGDASAQRRLGDLAKAGKGTDKSDVRAASWYRKAADQDDAEAQVALGMMYLRAEGMPQDMAEAARLLRRAADQGAMEGQFRLGCMYILGMGVPKDHVNGYHWLNLAAAQGHSDAAKFRETYKKLMTAEQISEAQRLSREFVPKPVAERGPSTARATELRGTGTGFFVTTSGFLVTNQHVVDSGVRFEVVTDSGKREAKLVKSDAQCDLAVLKVEGEFPALPIAHSLGSRLGSVVATVGFPNPGLQGFLPKLSKGEIASLAGSGDDPRYFQISVPIQPGNSGGALIDERGNVVGIVAGKLSAEAALASSGHIAENVNYAVKSSLLLVLLESLPEVRGMLPVPRQDDRRFEDVVSSAEKASVLVIVY